MVILPSTGDITMTPEQCLALVAADTRVREAARDVVNKWRADEKTSVAIAKLAVALAEFDRAMEEQK